MSKLDEVTCYNCGIDYEYIKFNRCPDCGAEECDNEENLLKQFTTKFNPINGIWEWEGRLQGTGILEQIQYYGVRYDQAIQDIRSLVGISANSLCTVSSPISTQGQSHAISWHYSYISGVDPYRHDIENTPQP